jgi:hypothetical protein
VAYLNTPFGPCRQPQVRFRGKADMKSAGDTGGSVKNDPVPTNLETNRQVGFAQKLSASLLAQMKRHENAVRILHIIVEWLAFDETVFPVQGNCRLEIIR